MLSEKENLQLLNKRISELDIKKKVVLSFDFDELVVPIHLTREVMKKISKPLNKDLLNKLRGCSFKGILYLNSLAYGFNFEEYKSIRDKISKETNWSSNFDKVLMGLMNDYSVIFISSGLKDICEAKLKEINFDSRNILGDELEIKNNRIVGSKLIISDELKGYIINKIKKNHKIVAVGHSLGDKLMLDNSDISISVNSGVKGLADYNIKFPKEIINILKKIR